MKDLVGVAKNGVEVFLDHDHTNLMVHVVETPNLLALVTEVLEQTEVKGDKPAIECDLGRIVGKTSLVETSGQDEIVYAKRYDRDSYSRFARNRELAETSFVTVILFRADENDGTYRLWSAWCGRLVPSVNDEGGHDFWANHALAYDPSIIDESTVMADRPEKYR